MQTLNQSGNVRYLSQRKRMNRRRPGPQIRSLDSAKTGKFLIIWCFLRSSCIFLEIELPLRVDLSKHGIKTVMTKTLLLILFVTGVSFVAQAAEIQGVIADWNCTERMVRDGREQVLRQDRNCSLAKNSNRSAYGLITDDKKFYKLDDAGNKQARELLNNSHDKNNLKVITRGELEGNTVKVETMSIL